VRHTCFAVSLPLVAATVQMALTGNGEANMALRRRHSPQEIASKLHQAEELLQLGKRQAEIARTLGISVMTYHRWRAAARVHQQAPSITPELPHSESGDLPGRWANILHDLEVENARLRRLLIDLLLEKMRLEEQLAERRC
jgi:putative transposase